MTIPNIDFLEARIEGCKTTDDCHVVWSELQDYLGTYDVTQETYLILYNKIKNRYFDITDDYIEVKVEPHMEYRM